MIKRFVKENVDAPFAALRVYALVGLVTAALIRFFSRSPEFLFSMSVCMCALVPFLVVCCHYYVGHEHEQVRRRFRACLSGITALGCAILLSHGGLRARSLNVGNALVFGVCAGVLTYLIGLFVSPVADLFLDRVRRFLKSQECGTCGYNLTGNTSGRCPECGSSVPLHQRASAPSSSKKTVRN